MLYESLNATRNIRKHWKYLLNTYSSVNKNGTIQGLVKGAILCFRNPYFYFRHGESTCTASQLTSPASQKSKDLNKVSLLLQDLGKEADVTCKMQ